MNQEQQFGRGQYVHFIQARLALENHSEWQSGVITELGDGTLTVAMVETNEIKRLRCIETQRIRDVYTSGRVPSGKDGLARVILASRGVLIILCADEGKQLADKVTFNPLITAIVDGRSQFSPTENGAWHLFSVKEVVTNS